MVIHHDGIEFDSFEEMSYYGRAKGWLKGQHAVAVRQNAFLLSRLVISYAEEHPIEMGKKGKGKSKVETASNKSKGTATTTPIDNSTTFGLTAALHQKTRETTGTRMQFLAILMGDFLAANPIPPTEMSLFDLETVADLVAHCQDLLRNKSEDFCKKVLENVPYNFDKFIMDALRGLIRTSKLSMEVFGDFSYMFELAVQEGSVRDCLEQEEKFSRSKNNKKRKRAVSPIEDAKQFAWKLTCLHALCGNSYNRQGRRQRLVSSAATIGLLCTLDELHNREQDESPQKANKISETEAPGSQDTEDVDSEDEVDGDEVDGDEADESMPRATVGQATSESSAENPNSREGTPSGETAVEVKPTKDPPRAVSSDESDKKGVADSSEEKPDSKRVKTSTMENDAIAALSMMLSTSPSASPVQIETKNPVDIVTEIATKLHSHLSTQLGDQSNMGPPLLKEEVEDEIVNIASRLVLGAKAPIKDMCLPDVNDALLTRLEFLLIPWSPSMLSSETIDEELQSEHRRQQKKCLSPNRGMVRFLDEAGLVTEDDSCISRIIHRARNPEEATTNCKRPAIYTLEHSIEERVLPMSSLKYAQPMEEEPVLTDAAQSMVANAIASLTSAGQELNRIEAAKAQVELNDWCKVVLNTSVAGPSKQLLVFLEASDKDAGKKEMDVGGWRDVVVPALNHVVFRLTEDNNEEEEENPFLVTLQSGELSLDDPTNPDKRLCTAVVALYYQALESLLIRETARLKKAAHTSLLQRQEFHRALLSCCYVCVVKAVSEGNMLQLTVRHRELDVIGAIAVMESTPYSFLRTSESFSRAMQVESSESKQTSLKMPKGLLEYIESCETEILDSYIWMGDEVLATDGSVMKSIEEMQHGTEEDPSLMQEKSTLTWPPPELQPTLPEERDEYGEEDVSSEWTTAQEAKHSSPSHRYAVYVLRRLLRVVHSRILDLCTALKIDYKLPVASQTWVAFRFMMRHFISLLRDRHVDQLLLCTLYVVCKLLRYEPSLSFGTIIEAYTEVRSKEIGQEACSRIVRQVRLGGGGGGAQQEEYGNVIHLYNRVFVPEMKQHLLQSKSLIKSTAWMQSYYEGSNLTRLYKNDCGPQGFVAIGKGNVHLRVCPWTEQKPASPKSVYYFGWTNRSGLDKVNEEMKKTTDETALWNSVSLTIPEVPEPSALS